MRQRKHMKYKKKYSLNKISTSVKDKLPCEVQYCNKTLVDTEKKAARINISSRDDR